MDVSSGSVQSLPALLEPSQYTSCEAFQHDARRLRGGTWQLLAAASLSSGTTSDTDVCTASLLARVEEGVVRFITRSHSPRYRHVHVFPNVMASFTDTFGLYYQIHPVDLAQCRLQCDQKLSRNENQKYDHDTAVQERDL